jgi:hypothetical protein
MKYSIRMLSVLALTTSFAFANDAVNQEDPKNIPTDNIVVVNPVTAPKATYSYNYNYSYDKENKAQDEETPMQLTPNNQIRVSVSGEGVAPTNTSSPAQAYALARRAAIADAYRLVAEKVKGIHVEGQDYIKNMMVKSSVVRTQISAIVRNAQIVETTFKDGLCEVEMEIVISGAQFAH